MHWAHVLYVLYEIRQKNYTHMYMFSFFRFCIFVLGNSCSITIVLYYKDSDIFSRIFSKYLPQIIPFLLPVLSPHFSQLSIMRADYFQSQVLPISHKSQFTSHFTNLIICLYYIQ